MGLLQSAHRKGGTLHFEEDCHDVRDDKGIVLRLKGHGEYFGVPGPPSRIFVECEAVVKEERSVLKYQYDGMVLTGEAKRLLAMLMYCGKAYLKPAGGFPAELTADILSFIDFSSLQAYGPSPFYSSRSWVLMTCVQVTNVTREKPVKYTVRPAPTHSRMVKRREATDITVNHGAGRTHPSHLMMPIRSWTDGWKRAHFELEYLPVFLLDDADPTTLLMVTQYQPFGMREVRG
eukprot:TRINITY_DN24556_c3_g1_i1.p1 TRINITY_DN24556_c3_g1~~TRINITY_DN24556_c3_g1_i1.p1  ORF type:complete len:233 (+),score=35.44 TRINITY_DN24556_c3_g1_i1:67-765(+)